jgi:hypothetical protein
MVLNNFGAAMSDAMHYMSGTNHTKTYKLWNLSNNDPIDRTAQLINPTVLRTPRAWYNYSWSADTGVQIVLGSGDTAVTEDDYKLDTMIDPTAATLEYISGEVPVISSAKTIYHINNTLRNASANTLTIREIGLTARLAYSWQSNEAILLAREVLSTPVTMQPNQVLNFAITVNLNT